MKLIVNCDVLHNSKEFMLKDTSHRQVITIRNMLPVFGVKTGVFDKDNELSYLIDRVDDENRNSNTFRISNSNDVEAMVQCNFGLFSRTYHSECSIGKVEISSKASDSVIQILIDGSLTVDAKIVNVNNDKSYKIILTDEDNAQLLLSMLYAALILLYED